MNENMHMQNGVSSMDSHTAPGQFAHSSGHPAYGLRILREEIYFIQFLLEMEIEVAIMLYLAWWLRLY
jgi:hypothetical protein